MSDQGEAADRLIERVARLEGRLDSEEQSIARRVGQWGGLVALVISITVGGFQIYQNLVLRDREAIETDRRELAGYVRQITELNTKIVTLAAEGNPALHMIVKVLNAEKMSVLGLADRVLTKRPALGDFSSFFTFATEHLNNGSNERAHQYAEAALSAASSVPERVEAHRLIARTTFAPGGIQNIPVARAAFASALDKARDIDTYLRVGLMANLYSDWIVSEAAFGDCERARVLWKQFSRTMSDERSGTAVLRVIQQEVRNAMSQIDGCHPF